MTVLSIFHRLLHFSSVFVVKILSRTFYVSLCVSSFPTYPQHVEFHRFCVVRNLTKVTEGDFIAVLLDVDSKH